MSKSFHFYAEFNLPVLLGIKTRTINGLLENLKTIPDSSVYYHTHRFLKQHHYLVPEPPNDFSYWIRNVLNMRELGELIASINISTYKSIEDLRAGLISKIENFLNKEAYEINCNEVDSFQFMSCKSFCIPLRYKASNLKEFADILENITVNSFYYHIFETQLRLGRQRNDFSEWFDSIGKKELAEKVSSLDPYTTTLEGLRKNIIKLAREYDNA